MNVTAHMARTREKSAPPPATPVVAAGESVQASHLGPQILRGLRERILSWHYPPGHHLAEKTLCEEFSASRIPVREALKALAATTLGALDPGAVVNIETDILARHVERMLAMSKETTR